MTHASIIRARKVLERVESKTAEHRAWRDQHAQALEDAASDRLLDEVSQLRGQREQWQTDVNNWEKQCAEQHQQHDDLILKDWQTSKVAALARKAPSEVDIAVTVIGEEVGRIVNGLEAKIMDLQRQIDALRG